MSSIKNVTIAGATGNLGPAILTALLSSNVFKVTVLTRHESKHTFPSNVTVKPVDYKSASSLTAALAGQDAVVATISATALADQKTLIDASIAAGVQRFIPSEFGSDTVNANTAALPVFGDKIAVQAYLKEKSAANPSFSYSLIINGGLLDWGLAVGFLVDVKGKKGTYKDGGDVVFSATTLATVGQAVVGTLLKPEATANRAVYIKDADVTQKKLVSIAKKFVGEEGWVIDDVKSADLEKSSLESLGKGEITMQVMINFIHRAIFGAGYGGHFTKVDNELLGIKELDDAGLEALVKGVVGA